MPVPSSSSFSAGSIYPRCRSILDALAVVPGFNAYYHADDKNSDHDDDYIPRPFYRLWQICRKGRVLCHLFNLLKPGHAIDMAACDKPKALVYRFIIACGNHLQLNEDNLFTVSEMYHDDTNGFIKVVNTLEKLLVLLKQHAILTVDYPPPESPRVIPQTLREKVIFELLETERKYVQDLETLQNYTREVRSIVSLDMIHHVFGNLNALLEFQLRFLLFAEYHADAAADAEAAADPSLSPEQKNISSGFGRCIVRLEDAFSVYEPYCANLQHGLDMAIQLAPQLSTTSIEPTYELPSYLIKPVQRVCKYPLLLQQLILYTPAKEDDDDAKSFLDDETTCRRQDLLAGMEAIQRVASKVNETRRTQENTQWVKELKERVSDWRGITDVDRQCGHLLLHDRVFVHQAEASKEVTSHLFEKAILLCGDVLTKKQKKRKDTLVNSSNGTGGGSSSSSGNSNSNSGSNNSNSSSSSSNALVVIGMISINGIAQVIKDQDAGLGLRIFYSSSKESQFLLESFKLEFRNEELLVQWEAAIQRLVLNSRKRLPQLTLDLPLMDESNRTRDIPDNEALSPTFLSYASMNKLPLRSYSSHSTMSSSSSSDPCPQQIQKTPIEHSVRPHSSNTHHTIIAPQSPHSSASSPSSSSSSSRFHQGGSSPPSPPPSSCSSSSTLVDTMEHSRARSRSTPSISYNHHHHPCAMYNHHDHHQQHQHQHQQQQQQQNQQHHMFMSRSGSATIKVKLHYNRNGTFVFYAPRNINYKDLRMLAERKTQGINKGFPQQQHQHPNHDLIKYKDEDGKLITIHCDEDIRTAFESGSNRDAVHLYIAV